MGYRGSLWYFGTWCTDLDHQFLVNLEFPIYEMSDVSHSAPPLAKNRRVFNIVNTAKLARTTFHGADAW